MSRAVQQRHNSGSQRDITYGPLLILLHTSRVITKHQILINAALKQRALAWLEHSKGFQEMMGMNAQEQLSVPHSEYQFAAVTYHKWQSTEAGNQCSDSAPYTLPHVFCFIQRQIAVGSSNQWEIYRAASPPHCAITTTSSYHMYLRHSYVSYFSRLYKGACSLFKMPLKITVTNWKKQTTSTHTQISFVNNV